MKVISNVMSLMDFDAWSGAVDTKESIIQAGKVEEFESWIEELYPDGLTDTQLNDILWFEPEMILKDLGIEEDEEGGEK